MMRIVQRFWNTVRQIELELENGVPPPSVGVNATIIVQNCPGASVVQLPMSTVKPLSAGGFVRRGVIVPSVPVLVRRTFAIAVRPTLTSPKSMSAGDAVNTGCSGGGGAAITVSANALVACTAPSSVTRTVKLYAPGVVGLPDRTPVAESSTSPGGALPALTAQFT